MKNISIIFAISCILSINTMNAQLCKNISQKEAFTIGYPQFYTFRGEMKKKAHTNYEVWKTKIENSNGIMRKFVNEEITSLNPNSPSWADSYALANPSKLMLLHLNGQTRQVNHYPDIGKKYFPGHWVYEEGSLLKQSISEQDLIIQVKDAIPFKEKAYKGRSDDSSGDFLPHFILLVKLDEKGNKLWYQSEIAKIEKVDKVENKLTIIRAEGNTSSLSFEGNKTYVAPIAGGFGGGDLRYYYNLSSNCPKDKSGKTAADIFIEEIAQWFSKKGPLRNFDGIAFDVNYWDVSIRKTWDTNNDGKKDGGWINNLNKWREGDYEFLKKLRTKMGNQFIITADAHLAENQQALGILNGIESEGLVQHNDGWRGFSRTINTHQYWGKYNTMQPQFRYVALKFENNPEDLISQERLQRFAIGTACCLKAFTAEPTLPNNKEGREVLPEWLRETGALGQATGELIRYAKQSLDIFNKTLPEIEKMIVSEDCKINLVNDKLEISANQTASTARDLIFTLKNIELPEGDITIFIEAQAIDPLEGIKLEEPIPRIMWATITGLPNYGEGPKMELMYNNLYGMFGTKQFDEISFYYRRPNGPTDAKNVDLNIRVQGRGKIVIRSIKIYNQADILIRKFEKGAVIVNPSLKSLTVDLNVLGLKKEIIEVPSVDGSFIKLK